MTLPLRQNMPGFSDRAGFLLNHAEMTGLLLSGGKEAYALRGVRPEKGTLRC